MLRLEIVTPEKKVVDAEVDSVTIPTASGEAGILIWATTWFWLGIPIFAIAGPLVYFIRIRRVRAKRERLRRAEWLVE